MMEEDDYNEEEEESGGMMIAIGEDGRAKIHNPEDYVEVLEKDMDLIRGFIKENQDLFNKYVEETKK